MNRTRKAIASAAMIGATLASKPYSAAPKAPAPANNDSPTPT